MSVRRSMMWSFTGNGAMFVSSLVTSMIVARLLTPAEMGAFAVGVATMAVIQGMLQMGLAGFLIREPDLEPRLIGSAIAVAALQGLAISLLLFALAPAVGAFQRSAQVTQIVLLIAAVPLLSSVEAIATALWSRAMDFKSVARLTTAKALAQAVLSIGLALAGFGAVSLALGYLLASLLGLALAIPSLLGNPLNLTHWRRLTRFGSVWMLLGGIRALNTRIPEFLLGRVINLSAAGLYNRASASADMVSRAGIDPLARVMLPVLAREHKETGQLAPGIIRLSSTLTAIFWPILGALALLAEPVILVLYGSQWRPAAPVLSLLSLWVAVALTGSGSGESLLLLDRLKLSARFEAARTALALIIITLAAPFGLVVVAAARVIETGIGIVPYIIALRRLIGLSIGRWLTAHSWSAALAVFSVGPLWLFRTYVEQPSSPLLQLIVAAPLFLAFNLAGLFILRHPLAGEVTRLLKAARSRVFSPST
jgi:O-antigen/teichoic acid export membrane protein